MVIKSLRELAESGGSNLATIEKYVRQSFSGAAALSKLSKLLRLAARKAVEKGLLVQEGHYYRVVPRSREAAEASRSRKRGSSFASSTPVPPDDDDDSDADSDGDSGHPLDDDEDDLHNRTHSSVHKFFFRVP